MLLRLVFSVALCLSLAAPVFAGICNFELVKTGFTAGKYSLRLLKKTDFAALKKVLQDERSIEMQGDGTFPDSDIRLIIQQTQAAREQVTERTPFQDAYFAILDASARVIGMLVVREHGKGVGELGYAVLPKLWGRGVMSAVLPEAVRVFTTEWHFDRLIAATYEDNLGSRKVLEKAGFLAIGQRHDLDYRGRLRTRIGYAFEP